MTYFPYDLGSLVFALAQLAIAAVLVLLVVILVRLALAATRTLNVIAAERTLRIELLQRQIEEDDLSDPSAA